MKASIRSRRGSSAVFLCVILSALVTICFAFIYSTREYTTASRADALMRLSAQSLLSEYDRTLLEEYGLLVLHQEDGELSRKLRQYMAFTFGGAASVSVTDCRASGASHVLVDPEPVRQQILSYMKAGGALKLRSESSGSSGSPEDAGHALRHGPTITSLPSRQLPGQDLLSKAQTFGDRLSELAGDPSSLSGIFTDGTDRYLLTSYALGIFNQTGRTVDTDHFFLREVEYLLNGELTDRENLRRTRSSLAMLRLSSNLAHIYTDPVKQEALLAAAEVLSPGAGAILAQAALATAWAYGESLNDADLLILGFRVPLVKDDSSWALDLEHIIEKGSNEGGPVRPDVNKGLTYRQYLRILLFLEDENLLCARIQDLIQINMRKNADGSFLIGECSTGLESRASVNRREYRYETIYQRILYP